MRRAVSGAGDHAREVLQGGELVTLDEVVDVWQRGGHACGEGGLADLDLAGVRSDDMASEAR